MRASNRWSRMIADLMPNPSGETSEPIPMREKGRWYPVPEGSTVYSLRLRKAAGSGDAGMRRAGSAESIELSLSEPDQTELGKRELL